MSYMQAASAHWWDAAAGPPVEPLSASLFLLLFSYFVCFPLFFFLETLKRRWLCSQFSSPVFKATFLTWKHFFIFSSDLQLAPNYHNTLIFFVFETARRHTFALT